MNNPVPRLPSLHGSVIGFSHWTTMSDPDPGPIGPDIGLEIDVRLTADGVAVVSRERSVGPRFRRRPIDRLNRSQLPAGMPSLSEFSATLPAGTPISVDAADAGVIEAILAEVEVESDLWLCSNDLGLLRRWRNRTPANLAYRTSVPGQTSGLERIVSDLVSAEITGLRLHHQEWTGGRITLAHRFGLAALADGLVHEREMVGLVNVGIDALYSDQLERMVSAIAQFEHRGPTR